MNNEFTIHDDAWAKQLERDYEEYMSSCWSSLDDEELSESDLDFETLSGQPFCGCNTCETRETLFFFTPRLLKAAEEGKVTLEK